MSRLIYVQNWFIDFDQFDSDKLLDTAGQYGIELRLGLNNAKYLRIFISVENETKMHQFTSEVSTFIDGQEWQPASLEGFETASPISHTLENRQQAHDVFTIIRNGSKTTSRFYKRIFKSIQPFFLYRAQWPINKRGLDNAIIEEAFRIVEQYEDPLLAISLEETAFIYFYLVVSKPETFDEILSQLPLEARNLAWACIEPEEVPDSVLMNPRNFALVAYSAWNERLYAIARRNEQNS